MEFRGHSNKYRCKNFTKFEKKIFNCFNKVSEVQNTNPTTLKSGSVGIVVFFSAAQKNYIIYRDGLLGPKICNS